MGIPAGAVKYFVGMGTSVWGILTAYLFAQSLLEPMDYVESVRLLLVHHDKPTKLVKGLIGVFVTTPSDFVGMVLVGLGLMTVLWVIGMARQ